MSSQSGSQSLVVDTEEMAFPGSSPLISSSAKDEFMAHLQHLPPVLDLSVDLSQSLDLGQPKHRPIGSCEDVSEYIDHLFNQSQNDLKSLSDDTLQNAKDRVQREQRNLEMEYKQYYDDQTEMLILKLNKHRENPAKMDAETQATMRKLDEKRRQQSAKFRSTVNDQLQILRLTQDLNDDTNTPNLNTIDPVPETEEHLYKETIDKAYFQRVQEFKAKQKLDLKTFEEDLRRLTTLHMEVYAKHKRESSLSNRTSNQTNPEDRISATATGTTSNSTSPVRVTAPASSTLESDNPFTIQEDTQQQPLRNGHHLPNIAKIPPPLNHARSTQSDVFSGVKSTSGPDDDMLFSPNNQQFYQSASVPSILDHNVHAQNGGNVKLNGYLNKNTQIHSQQAQHIAQGQQHQQQQQQYSAAQGQYQRQTASMMQNQMQNDLQQNRGNVSRTQIQPNSQKAPQGMAQTMNNAFDLHSNTGQPPK